MSETGTERYRVGLRCLAPSCGNVAEDIRDHKRHLADADHPDHGEVVVDLPAHW
ncbi:hypothetical protein [Halorientalis halophila]|uniref:hypothetical protein n=1 Tax=Halorientalis halophila TaxID=3108499 RepID=UPI003009507E